MISEQRYWLFLFLVSSVYIIGWFNPLMENDSAQFAVMAMRMVQEHDFLHLYKGLEPYLDKPHMHYWLSSFSYLLFGIKDWAYRLPALLLTALAAYSCYGLGKQLYQNQSVGKLAALIFLTAQTIVLAGFDVRTDSVLTGFTIFSIWQLVRYIDTQKLDSILWGAAGAALAFSTKGQIALVVIGLPILCYLLQRKKVLLLFRWPSLLALLTFFLVCSPMLYAYYIQFDLHPELIIRGRSHRSGIFFILWEQSFERMSGTGIGQTNGDYLFFFHTFLWVFLPWTILGLVALGKKIPYLFKIKKDQEILTLGGFLLILLLISFAQFKLPHYLNITIPLVSILTAGYLVNDFELSLTSKKKLILLAIQKVVLIILILISLVLMVYVFPGIHWTVGFILIAHIALFSYLFFEKTSIRLKLIGLTVMGSIVVNSVMNLHFYPRLLQYQGGSEMATLIHQNGIPKEKIYKIKEEWTWPLDFYTQRLTPVITAPELLQTHDIWVYGDLRDLELLQSQEKLEIGPIFEVDHFRITRLNWRFLNPKTRPDVLQKRVLFYLP